MFLNICILILFNLINCFQKSKLDGIIEMSALGRIEPNLGELYDARSDNFISKRIIGNLPESLITTRENIETNIKYSLINTIEDKLQTLEVSANVQLSFLFGLIKMGFGGKLIRDTKTTEKSTKVCLSFRFSSLYQQIILTDKKFKNLIKLDELADSDSTHIVVGIQWGGSAMITVEDSHESKSIQTHTEGSIIGKLNSLADSISKNNQYYNEYFDEELNKFKFQLFGDLPKTDLEQPKNLIDAIKFIKTVPALAKNANEGKGQPIKFTLMPISSLFKAFNLSINHPIYKGVDGMTVKKSIKLFDSINRMQLKFNDIYKKTDYFKQYLPDDQVNKISKLKDNYDNYYDILKNNLSAQLIAIRSGKQPDTLQENIFKIHKDPVSILNLDFNQFDNLRNEITFMEMMQRLNVTMLTKDISPDGFAMINQNMNYEIYVLLYKNLEKDQIMISFRKMISSKQSNNTNVIFAAKYVKNINSISSIRYYKKGQLINDNFIFNDQ